MKPPILAAIEFSELGEATLAAATKLAIDLGAPLVLVHAYPAARYGPSLLGNEGPAVVGQQHAQMATIHAIELTGQWAERARLDGADVEAVCRDGEPAHLILQEAKARQAAIIVVGSHGRSVAGRLLMGSVTREILKRSNRPVLVVPATFAPKPRYK